MIWNRRPLFHRSSFRMIVIPPPSPANTLPPPIISNANPPFWIPIHIVIPERSTESTVFNVIILHVIQFNLLNGHLHGRITIWTQPSNKVTPGFGNGFQATPNTSTTNGIPPSLTPPSWDGFASLDSYLFSCQEYFDSESKKGKKITEQDYDMVALHCSPVSNFSAYVSPKASAQLAATTTWCSGVTTVAFDPTCGGSVIAIVIVEGT
ncbi:unnamed protein product [Lactuca virosa]|uniref:Uncharacterized protein n=1 Tax=Lactuca virosa TaxID=75947 RepID=A0AAU9LBH7_9ASTR|nr:unnamed protein product [Lactuca virosa]